MEPVVHQNQGLVIPVTLPVGRVSSLTTSLHLDTRLDECLEFTCIWTV